MRSFLDAKAMATTLRQELKSRKIELGHSECLEVVAKQFGFRDWNTMAGELPKNEAAHPITSTEAEFLPKGWHKFGRHKDFYTVGYEPCPERPSEMALFVENKSQAVGEVSLPEDSYASITQTCLANQFVGQAVAFSSDIRCNDIKGSASIWTRVDDKNGVTVAFTDLANAKIGHDVKKKTEWTRREVVLEVPVTGSTIHFGFYLSGVGKAWASRLSFDLTDEAPTLAVTTENLALAPQNLDLRLN